MEARAAAPRIASVNSFTFRSRVPSESSPLGDRPACPCRIQSSSLSRMTFKPVSLRASRLAGSSELLEDLVIRGKFNAGAQAKFLQPIPQRFGKGFSGERTGDGQGLPGLAGRRARGERAGAGKFFTAFQALSAPVPTRTGTPPAGLRYSPVCTGCCGIHKPSERPPSRCCASKRRSSKAASGKYLDRLGRDCPRRENFGGEVLEHQGNVVERVLIQPAFRIDGLDHFLEWALLMGLGLEHGFAR